MKAQLCVLCLLVFVLNVGCAGQVDRLNKSVTLTPLEDYKFGPKGGVDLVWSTKRIRDAETLKTTLQKYDSLLLDQTWLVVDKKSSDTLSDKQVLATSRHMLNELKARLGLGFKQVDAPTENTLRLSVALINVEASPLLAVASALLSARGTAPGVARIVAGEQVNAGPVTVELLVRDARSGEPLVAAIDKQFDGQDLGTLIESPDGAEDAISLWADRLWITLRDWNWIQSRPANP